MKPTCSECELDVDGSHDDGCTYGMSDSEIKKELYEHKFFTNTKKGVSWTDYCTGWPVIPNGGSITVDLQGIAKRTWLAVSNENQFNRELLRWLRVVTSPAYVPEWSQSVNE